MTRLQGIQSNRAKQFARKVDAIRTTSKVEAPNVRSDISAPTVHVDAISGQETVVRQPLHLCGSVPTREGKAHGTIATPSSYGIWLRAGMPPHPIYNPVAWKAERYVNGIALPTGGRVSDDRYIGKGRFIASTANMRHEQGCTCSVCAEYHRSMAQRKLTVDPRISPRDLKPLVRVARTQRTITVLVPPLKAVAAI